MPTAADPNTLAYTTPPTHLTDIAPEEVMDAIASMQRQQPMPGFQRSGNTVTVEVPFDWNYNEDGEYVSGSAPGVLTIAVEREGKGSKLTVSYESSLETIPEVAQEFVSQIFFEQLAPQLGPAFAQGIAVIVQQGRGL